MTFRPERFLDDDNQLVPSDHINRRRVLAFGAGVRVCLGEKLAMARLFIFVTTLIDEFRIEKQHSQKNENFHDPRNYTYNTLLKPKNVSLHFVDRSKIG